MSALDIEALRDEWIGVQFEEKSFEINADAMADYAKACGEVAPAYTDPADPDFQAPPTFPSSLSPGRRLPEGFPELPGMGMDAGKAVAPINPIRPDMVITGKTHLHDVYSKTGRSGRMTFFVTRMALYDQTGQPLATADTRVVIREKPDPEE